MSAPQTVAITGLQSFIGRGVAERLSERSRLRVIGVDRHAPARLRRIPLLRVDLTDPDSHTRLAEHLERERVDVVLHAAFRSDPTPDLELDHELETIGSLQVFHACEAAKVRRLVVASTTMAYGARADNPNFLQESHPLRGHPDAHCVQNRVEMESLLAEWTRKHPDTEVTVLRHGWMMGPHYWDGVVAHFARPAVTTLMGYDPMLQFVHEEDCLDVFEAAVLERHPGIYNVVAREVLPLSALLRLAGKRAVPLPAPLLYRANDLGARALTGDPPAGFYDYLRYLWVADGERAWNEFGEPAYTTREAWAAFVSSQRMRRYR